MKTKNIKYFVLTKSIGLYINAISFFSNQIAAKKAYQIFSKPRKGKIKTHKFPEVLKDAKKEQIFVGDNFCQTYIWAGSSEIILLIHGWESNASRWKKMLPDLKKTGKTIIAIDAPAHGNSCGKEFNVPKYVTFIEKLTEKYNPNIIIGHSIGGFASLYYQYLHQNSNLDKIILLGAPSDLQLMLDNYCDLLSLNFRARKALERLSEQLIKMKIDEFSGKNFAKKITTKTLVIHDLHDQIVSINEGKKIHTSLKNGLFLETKGFGHGLNNKKVFDEIISFLEH